MYRCFLNQRNLQWIAVASTIIFVLVEVSTLVPLLAKFTRHDYWHQNLERCLSLLLHREYWSEYLVNNLAMRFARICSDIVLIIAISTSLVAGGFLIHYHLYFRRALALFIVGTLLASYSVFWPIAGYLFESRHIQKFRESNKEFLARMRSNLDAGKLAPEILDHAWKSYANSVYVHTGKCIEFPISSGAKERFEPTEKDKKLRQYLLDSYSRWRQPPYSVLILWGSLFLISVLMSAFLPRYFQSKEQKHSATDT